MNNMKRIIFISGLFFVPSVSATDKGICITWSEGDSQSLDGCKAASLKECSKKKKEISNKDTTFQSYKGRLFRDSDNAGKFYEFRTENAVSCDSLNIDSARGQEETMSSNWGYIVYSENLKSGEKAFVYGKKVIVRETGSVKSKKLFNADENAEVKILEKSKTKEKVGKGITEAYWFKVKTGGKEGWIYGQYVHPNPKSKTTIGL